MYHVNNTGKLSRSEHFENDKPDRPVLANIPQHNYEHEPSFEVELAQISEAPSNIDNTLGTRKMVQTLNGNKRTEGHTLESENQNAHPIPVLGATVQSQGRLKEF